MTLAALALLAAAAGPGRPGSPARLKLRFITVPPLQSRKVPKQGESFTLEGVSAAGAPR